MGFSIRIEAHCPKGEKNMYDMYPDWGPAKHDPDHPLRARRRDASQSATSTTGTALRDDDDLRPDDN